MFSPAEENYWFQDQDAYVFIFLYNGGMELDYTTADGVTMEYLAEFEREEDAAHSVVVF